jgi:hypothetical protein
MRHHALSLRQIKRHFICDTGGLAVYDLIITIITTFFIEKSSVKGYITEEGVSTGKCKNEQYQKFKF